MADAQAVPVTWHEVGCPHCDVEARTSCRTPKGQVRMTPHVVRRRYAAGQERHPKYGLNAKARQEETRG